MEINNKEKLGIIIAFIGSLILPIFFLTIEGLFLLVIGGLLINSGMKELDKDKIKSE